MFVVDQRIATDAMTIVIEVLVEQAMLAMRPESTSTVQL